MSTKLILFIIGLILFIVGECIKNQIVVDIGLFLMIVGIGGIPGTSIL